MYDQFVLRLYHTSIIMINWCLCSAAYERWCPQFTVCSNSVVFAWWQTQSAKFLWKMFYFISQMIPVMECRIWELSLLGCLITGNWSCALMFISYSMLDDHNILKVAETVCWIVIKQCTITLHCLKLRSMNAFRFGMWMYKNVSARCNVVAMQILDVQTNQSRKNLLWTMLVHSGVSTMAWLRHAFLY